jgi:hypothetical protein
MTPTSRLSDGRPSDRRRPNVVTCVVYVVDIRIVCGVYVLAALPSEDANAPWSTFRTPLRSLGTYPNEVRR